jgi:Creatinase/Prolidase N-terminal domain
MRRGLMAWDADEIPVRVLTERAARLQAAMAAADQDAMILYTNFIRSAAVSHLSAFSPYWADGMLLVPRQGEIVFATTLSKRVGTWIQSVKPVGDLVNSPTPGKMLGERLAKAGGVRRVAILELDAFPAGLYAELSAALPGVEFVDGSDAFASVRVRADAVERRLLERADSIAQYALTAVRSEMMDVGLNVGGVEMQARLQGAEEVYVAVAPDLDIDRRFLRLSGNHPLGRRFAIRATVAYKGSWARRTKTYSQDSKDRLAIERADTWFQALAGRISPSRPFHDQIASAAAGLPSAKLIDWLAEAPVGTRPLGVLASPSIPNSALQHAPALICSMSMTIDGMPWCGARLIGGIA